MQAWIIDIMKHLESLGPFIYFGIILLIAVENIFPPIPSEIILTFGGFMTTYSAVTIWGVILSATIGSVIGAIALYGVGRLLSADRLSKLLEGKIGKLLHFKPEDVYKACDWFNTRGKKTVFLCRCVPILRSLISIPAGMARMKFGIFLLLTTLGSFIWNIVLVYLGAAAGSAWQNIVDGTGVYQTITIVVLGIIAVIVLIWYLKFRKKNQNN